MGEVYLGTRAAAISRSLCVRVALLVALCSFLVGTAACGSAATAELSTIHHADLPAEAQRTLTLIDRGGPFPYEKDGAVFENRERLLPIRRSGYYHEYTVPTPGETDRGARRIVAGDKRERYYTADHYASFLEIVR